MMNVVQISPLGQYYITLTVLCTPIALSGRRENPDIVVEYNTSQASLKAVQMFLRVYYGLNPAC
jgi:hypothetical protein